MLGEPHTGPTGRGSGHRVRDSAPPSADGEPGYRVLFTRANGRGRGTIVVADAGEAHREAHSIAQAGGRAQVQYLTRTGALQTLASYP